MDSTDNLTFSTIFSESAVIKRLVFEPAGLDDMGKNLALSGNECLCLISFGEDEARDESLVEMVRRRFKNSIVWCYPSPGSGVGIEIFLGDKPPPRRRIARQALMCTDLADWREALGPEGTILHRRVTLAVEDAELVASTVRELTDGCEDEDRLRGFISLDFPAGMTGQTEGYYAAVGSLSRAYVCTVTNSQVNEITVDVFRPERQGTLADAGVCEPLAG